MKNEHRDHRVLSLGLPGVSIFVTKRLVVLVLLATSLSACHPWYMVESKYSFSTYGERPPEVVRAPGYYKLSHLDLTVAVSAPDECADRSSAETTGEAQTAGKLLQTKCGVEMAELERALVKEGYRVISWSALRQMALGNSQVSPLEAAQKLNADVLFQVNSLERSIAKPGQGQEWKRPFYESDSTGATGPVAHVEEQRAQALEKGVLPNEAVVTAERVSVTVNVTAVLVRTGETIWFFNATNSDRPAGSLTTTQLFQCNRRDLSYCVPQRPESQDGEEDTTETENVRRRSGGESVSQQPGEDADKATARYYQLVRATLGDVVREFSSGLATEQ